MYDVGKEGVSLWTPSNSSNSQSTVMCSVGIQISDTTVPQAWPRWKQRTCPPLLSPAYIPSKRRLLVLEAALAVRRLPPGPPQWTVRQTPISTP